MGMKPRPRLGLASIDVLHVFAKNNKPVTKKHVFSVLPAWHTYSAVKQTINRLRNESYVRRVRGEGPGAPGYYEITAKGFRALERIRRG